MELMRGLTGDERRGFTQRNVPRIWKIGIKAFFDSLMG
jgi:hypothetical protein